MHDFFRRRRLGTIAVAALALAVSGGLAIASVTAHAAGNAPTPYAQCPAIGSSPSCEILLVVNPNNSQPSDSTGLVTLSVGGNDVGFPFVMQACVNGFRNETTDSGCLAVIKTELGLGAKLLKQGGTILLNTQDNSYVFCDKACVAQFLSQGKKNKNSHLQVVTVPSLAGLYADVHQRAPQAEIRVLLYPHLFPASPSAQCTVAALFNQSWVVDRAEMKAINNAGDTLDGIIASAVNTASGQGVDIQVVDARPDFVGHEVCSADPWINGLDVINRVYSFHPNKFGQSDFASLFEAHL